MQVNSAHELKLRCAEATNTMLEDVLWAKLSTIPHPDGSDHDLLEATVVTHEGDRITKVL